MVRFALIGSGASARPVPAPFAPILQVILEESGAYLTSALRHQPAVNYARKRGAVLSSQEELYDGFVQGRPGFNPANPPGRSTHEQRSDGVAYLGPIGRWLRWWQIGLDIGGAGAQAFIATARSHGWIVTVTYPTNPLESHHVNFRKRPIYFRALAKGDQGRRVRRYSRRLAFIRQPHGDRYLRKSRRHFDDNMRAAVVAFQREHRLTPDGVIGAHTGAQIDHVFRRQWEKRGKGSK